MKYADVPVGLYTGVASVNVPLYELKGPHLSLPISLSYHAGGIRVEENSSSVGLGWSLNAGGAVTRTTKGLRDEAHGGYLSSDTLPVNPQIIGFFEEVVTGELDTEPDIFFYNLNGRSGKFYLDKKSENSGVVMGHSIPHQDIKIKCSFIPNLLVDFTITSEDGIEYFFNVVESTESRNYVYDVSSSIQGPVIKGDRTTQAETSWFLKEIRSPIGGEVITFTYVPEKSKYETPRNGRATYNTNSQLVTRTMSFSEVTHSGKRLTEIRYDKIGATVEFVPGNDRTDVAQFASDKTKSISQVVIRHDGSPDPVKRFDLITSYFTNPVSSQNYGGSLVPPERQYLFKRLRLDKVTERSGDGTQSVPPYSFKYNSIPLPPKNGETQDHWGYFNGPTEPFSFMSYYSNHYMMPGFLGDIDNADDLHFYSCNGVTESVSLANPALLDIDGANREPNGTSMQAGMLIEMATPMGGTTKLEYSPNYYGFVADNPVTKNIYEQAFPQAIIERPWEDSPTENETVEHEFIAPKTGVFKVEFEVEYGYKDRLDYESGISYNHNEVKLVAVGVPYPLVKVYRDHNNGIGDVYIEQTPEGTQYAGAVLLTNLDTDSQLYHGEVVDRDSDPENYGRRTGIGFVLVNLTAGHTYKMIATRQYVRENVCSQVGTPGCITNNNAAMINLHSYIDTDNIIHTETSFIAGGLRVTKKTDSPQFGGTPIVTKYDYELTSEDNVPVVRSAGCLLTIPQHVNTETFIEIGASPQNEPGQQPTLRHPVKYGCLGIEVSVFTKVTIDANITVPLSTTQGSHLSYRQVTVTQTGNGSTVTRFLTGYEHPDRYPKQFTYVVDNPAGEDFVNVTQYNFENETRFKNVIPLDNHDWKRGFEDSREVYDENGKILSKEKYNYSFPVKNTVSGLTVFWDFTNAQQINIGAVEYVTYQLSSGTPYMISKSVKSYTPVGDELKTEYTYFHESDQHVNLTRQIQTVSDGDVLETKFTYAVDKPTLTNTPTTVFDYMVGKNMIYNPVKTEVYRGTTLIEGTITNYKIVSGNVVPASEEAAKNGPYLVKLNYTHYDEAGNLIHITPHDNFPTAYLWDHKSAIPVASVVKAAPEQIAYAGFEADGKGGWSYNAEGIVTSDAKIGRRSFDIETQDIFRQVTAGRYVLSFWARGAVSVSGAAPTASSETPIDGGGWVMHEMVFVLTNTTTLTISSSATDATIDELRLFPAAAKMTTYSFDPLVGMTHKNDPNNVSSCYRYDKLGRLIAILDHEGNVLKKYTYHYVGQ